MTDDEIIELAREAGIRVASQSDTVDPRNVYPHELVRFAALVSAKEREECASVCEGHYDTAQAARAIRARGQE